MQKDEDKLRREARRKYRDGVARLGLSWALEKFSSAADACDAGLGPYRIAPRRGGPSKPTYEVRTARDGVGYDLDEVRLTDTGAEARVALLRGSRPVVKVADRGSVASEKLGLRLSLTTLEGLEKIAEARGLRVSTFVVQQLDRMVETLAVHGNSTAARRTS